MVGRSPDSAAVAARYYCSAASVGQQPALCTVYDRPRGRQMCDVDFVC